MLILISLVLHNAELFHRERHLQIRSIGLSSATETNRLTLHALVEPEQSTVIFTTLRLSRKSYFIRTYSKYKNSYIANVLTYIHELWFHFRVGEGAAGLAGDNRLHPAILTLLALASLARALLEPLPQQAPVEAELLARPRAQRGHVGRRLRWKFR